MVKCKKCKKDIKDLYTINYKTKGYPEWAVLGRWFKTKKAVLEAKRKKYKALKKKYPSFGFDLKIVKAKICRSCWNKGWADLGRKK